MDAHRSSKTRLHISGWPETNGNEELKSDVEMEGEYVYKYIAYIVCVTRNQSSCDCHENVSIYFWRLLFIYWEYSCRVY